MLDGPTTRRTIVASGVAAGIVALVAPLRKIQAQGEEAKPLPVERPRTDLIWGVNGHPIAAYPGIPIETQLDLVKALGFTQYRIDTKGDGSPEKLEEYLPLAETRGITLLPILHPDGKMEDLSAVELGDRAFELGRDMATRFKGRIPVWELSNELENFAVIEACETRFDGAKYPCDWGPAGGVGVLDYHPGRWPKVSAVIGGLSNGVAQADPDARRAVGTAGWGHLGAYERLTADGVAWDITVWHDYEGVPEKTLAFLAGYGKPIWITEFNADAGGTPPLSLQEQAEALTARIAYYRTLRGRYGIEAAHVYELLDETYWGDTFEARMGLVHLEKHGESWRPGALKPAGLAAQKAVVSG